MRKTLSLLILLSLAIPAYADLNVPPGARVRRLANGNTVQRRESESDYRQRMVRARDAQEAIDTEQQQADHRAAEQQRLYNLHNAPAYMYHYKNGREYRELISPGR